MADDDLRTRIAAVIYGDGHQPWTHAIQLADLLIWEFGLRDEWITPESILIGTIKTRRPPNAIATRVASTWKEI